MRSAKIEASDVLARNSVDVIRLLISAEVMEDMKA
jgi:hypothetical protein